MSNNYTKECCTCHEVKPANDFHKLKKADDGLQRACKICTLKRHSEYRKRTDCKYWKHKTNQAYTVYTFTNPEGMIYVGKTSTTAKLRYQRHRAQYKNQKHILDLLYTSFDTFGFDNHKFEVLNEHSTELEALQAETKAILRFKKQDKSLNIRLSSFPVGQYDKKTGKLIKEWTCAMEASKFFGSDKSSWIYASMTGYRGNKSAFGFLWKILPYEDGSIYDIKENKLIEATN
jgi:hypothetical protein